MNETYLNKGRTNQKLETREKILLSAQDLIKKGDKFTLEDIAKKANLSRATVYRYYSNVETLLAEAGLNIKTKSPEVIVGNLQQVKLKDKLMGVQAYYNNFALDNEKAFRSYLSIVLASDSKFSKRGARRNRTLQLVLAETNLSKKKITDLQNLFTLLMGIEPIIVSKDVCGLDNEQSKKLLEWGMELILKGISIEKKE